MTTSPARLAHTVLNPRVSVSPNSLWLNLTDYEPTQPLSPDFPSPDCTSLASTDTSGIPHYSGLLAQARFPSMVAPSLIFSQETAIFPISMPYPSLRALGFPSARLLHLGHTTSGFAGLSLPDLRSLRHHTPRSPPLHQGLGKSGIPNLSSLRSIMSSSSHIWIIMKSFLPDPSSDRLTLLK